MLRDKTISKYLKIIVLFIAIIYFIYSILRSINIVQNSGTLLITAPGSIITITKPNFEQKSFKNENDKFLLSSGNYTIIATKNNIQQTKIVTIYKKQTTKISMSPVLTKYQIVQNSKISIAEKLVNILPAHGPNYQWEMSYSYMITNNIAVPEIIIISNSQSGINNAINWLISKGYNPSDLNIEESISG